MLDDDSVPNGSRNVCAALQPLADALRHQPALSEHACQENRRYQITLRATRGKFNGRLQDAVRQTIRTTGVKGVNVVSSSHSVDIVAAEVSKLNAVRKLRETVGDAPILAIGDRGRWPGNDHDLLRERFALGVDEISVDPATCWHLGKPGQRGPAVTLDYLSSLEVEDRRLKFATGSLR